MRGTRFESLGMGSVTMLQNTWMLALRDTIVSDSGAGARGPSEAHVYSELEWDSHDYDSDNRDKEAPPPKRQKPIPNTSPAVHFCFVEFE